MFILSNYSKNAPFKVTKANNLDVIEAKINNLTFFSIEKNSPVQYFCVKHNESGSFSKRDFIQAKFFSVETIFERELTEKNDDANAYANLITDFGDKKTKERVAKKGLVNYSSKEPITFNIENQLLPPFDKDADSPRDAYSIDLMFAKETLEELESVKVDIDELSEYVGGIYHPGMKVHMLILDCIYKILVDRAVGENALGRCRVFYNEIKNDIVKGRLQLIARDKLVIKFLIILLIVSDFELCLGDIPKFFMTSEKLTTLLKIIGCVINKQGTVKLESMPVESFTSKRRKK